jgi:hypothetical protein
MAAVFGLGLGMSRQAGHHLSVVVDPYVPIYAAVSRANLRSIEESAALRGLFVFLLEGQKDDQWRGELRGEVSGAGAAVADLIAEAKRLVALGLVDAPDTAEAVLLARLDERLTQLAESVGPYERTIKEMINALDNGDRAAFDRLRDPYFALRSSITGNSPPRRKLSFPSSSTAPMRAPRRWRRCGGSISGCSPSPSWSPFHSPPASQWGWSAR